MVSVPPWICVTELIKNRGFIRLYRITTLRSELHTAIFSFRECIDISLIFFYTNIVLNSDFMEHKIRVIQFGEFLRKLCVYIYSGNSLYIYVNVYISKTERYNINQSLYL